ncbi:MAG: nuclear transport factor 2 family protein [Henriciella sp.]
MKNAILGLLVWSACLFGTATAQEDDRSVYADRSDISQVILKWAYYRDHGLWDELRETFHPDGEIQVTWYVGAFSGFVDASVKMAECGARSVHIIESSIVEVEGDRAIAITPVAITARASAGGMEIDMSSNAYFVDFLEHRADAWRITRRVAVYQKDRMDVVGPSARFGFFYNALNIGQYEPAYKHLAAALSMQNFKIQPGQIVDHTDASRALYETAQTWLRTPDFPLPDLPK